MPINNWRLILETGDLKYLFKSGKGRVTGRAADHWTTLQQEYIDEFDLDDNYKKLIRLQQRLTILNLNYVISRDRFLFNLITMIEKDIDDLIVKDNTKFGQLLDHVEKYKGYQIDPKVISVKRWYYSLKNMSESNG